MTPTERKSVNEMLAINTGLVEQNAKLLEALKCCRVFIPPSDYLNNTIKEAEEATP